MMRLRVITAEELERLGDLPVIMMGSANTGAMPLPAVLEWRETSKGTWQRIPVVGVQ